MVEEIQEAKDKPTVSKVDIFDSLLTISFFAKDLAKEVMLLDGDEKNGGEESDSRETFNLSSK